MDKDAVVKICLRFKDYLERKIKVDRLILFGSYAEKTSTEGSDIDLIIISDDFKSLSYWERIDLLAEAVFEIYEPIEPVAFTRKEFDNEESLVVEYAQQGEIIYSA